MLHLAQRFEDHLHQAEANHHLGVVNQYQKNWDSAVHHFQTAIDIRERIGLEAYLPFEYNSLGRVYAMQGDASNASEAYERAYERAKAMGFKGPMMFSQLYHGLMSKDQQAFRTSPKIPGRSFIAGKRFRR